MSTLNLKGICPMSPIVYRMNRVLSLVVQCVPIGTNLGIFYLLWMLLSGRLLLSAYGKWHTAQLLEAWEQLVREEQTFHAHQ